MFSLCQTFIKSRSAIILQLSASFVNSTLIFLFRKRDTEQLELSSKIWYRLHSPNSVSSDIAVSGNWRFFSPSARNAFQPFHMKQHIKSNYIKVLPSLPMSSILIKNIIEKQDGFYLEKYYILNYLRKEL